MTNLETWNQNLSENGAYLRCAHGVNEWKDLRIGKPVIVCGAGPSLDAAIPLLAKTDVPIIACDRAAKPLRAAGIKPFCIVTVEYHKEASAKLAGVAGLEGVPLVFDPLTCNATVSQYPGPLYTYDVPGVFVEGKGTIRRGTAVIISALGVAEMMDAGSIILVGADLGNPGGKLHAAGVNAVKGQRLDELFVKSVTGEWLSSHRNHIINVQEMQLACADGFPIIQTSPEGARIPGAKHMSLEEALR